MNKLVKRLKGDIVIWTVLGFLSFISLVSVYSSTGILSLAKSSGNTESYLIRQAILLIFGFVLMWFCHKVKWSGAFRKSAHAFLIISIILLILTLFFGVEVNGAKRWLLIPFINLQFQTSDLVKLLFIIYLAAEISKAKKDEYTFVLLLKKIYLPILIVCGLILPMNFSTSAMLFLVSCVMVFIGRLPMKSLFKFLGFTIGIVGIIVLISLAFPDSKVVPKRFTVWVTRIISFTSDDENVDMDDTYQADQAKIAIVRGGFFGKGPGNSQQRNYLPHPDCDFIFAIIVEEYGLIIGAGLIVILYLILLYRGLKISSECEKDFSSYMVFGIVFIYVVQAFIHMGVCVGLGPVTGQNLPMVSTGGTAMLMFCVAMGIVLSESRINQKRKLEEARLAEQELLQEQNDSFLIDENQDGASAEEMDGNHQSESDSDNNQESDSREEEDNAEPENEESDI